MIVPKYHIKKNDLVMVMNGKEKGKSGRVLKVLPEKEKVLVEKINFVKRHSRPHGKQRQGGILEKESPLHLSNVMLLCEKCNKLIVFSRLKAMPWARYCIACQKKIESAE